MYKVLIVDDEVLVRVGLKMTIDWESFGFEIVGEASSGAQGYLEYQKKQPDVIFTDIKMNNKDGLWLTEKIKNDRKDAYIIMLTCFDDFKLVRESMKLGADDYILKSEIENEELIENLKKIKCLLDKKNMGKKPKQMVSNHSLKQNLMQDLINSDMLIDDSILNRCKDVEFTTEESKFALFSLHLSKYYRSNRDKTIDLKQISKALKHLLVDKLEEYKIKFIFNSKLKSYSFILSSPELTKNSLDNLGRYMVSSAKNYFDVDVKIVYSAVYDDFTKTTKWYEEWLSKKKIIFYSFQEEKKIFNMPDIHFKSIDCIKLKKPYNQMILESLSEFDFDKANSVITEIITLSFECYIEPEGVRMFFSNLVRDILLSYRYLREYSEKIKKHIELNDLIMQVTYIENIETLIKELIIEIEIALNEIRSSGYKQVSTLAVEYIDRHFKESISLEDVAEHISMSKHYLSATFKKEIGINMSLYINQKKIEAAKKYIRSSDMKNKEIYSLIGFSNQQYFSKVFKKITGMTVKEYRER